MHQIVLFAALAATAGSNTGYSTCANGQCGRTTAAVTARPVYQSTVASPTYRVRGRRGRAYAQGYAAAPMVRTAPVATARPAAPIQYRSAAYVASGANCPNGTCARR